MLLSADLGALLLRRLIDLHLFRCLFVAIGRPRSAGVCRAYVGLAQIGDIGLTDPEFSLKVIVVMRPCDGTSGLVRENRRKAVFAFKGCFGKDFVALSCLERSVFIVAFESMR